MKALFYSHTGKVSGAENVLLLLLERLDRSRIAPVAVCPKNGGLAEKVSSLRVRVEGFEELAARFTLRPDLAAKYTVSVIRSVLNLRKTISQESPDLVHANSIRAGVVATIATIGTGIPVVWHIHDELKPHPISTAIRLLFTISARTNVLAVSRATLESFLGSIVRTKSVVEKCGVALNGVDAERFDVSDAEGEAVRSSLGIGRDEMVFASIGQITPRKNQKGLVEAFAAVSEEIPNARLVIAGAPIFNSDEAYFAEVKELVKWHGLEDRVHFLGQRRDVAQIISASDAVVVNSTSEALVLVAIEAMMAGRPVIATRVGGTAELVEHLVSGWLIPSSDRGSLEEALVRFAKNPALRMALAKEGRRVARSKFTAGRLVADVERFLTGRAAKNERIEQAVAAHEAMAGSK